MSAPQYFDYSPFTRILSEKSHYSQAVRIGDRIECSGQGTPPHTPCTSPKN
jgi:hypothetical protein